MYSFVPLLALAGGAFIHAAPTPTENDATVIDERGLIGDLVGALGGAVQALDNLGASATGTAGYASALSLLKTVTPTATPTSPEQAISSLSAIYQASPTPNNLYAALGDMVSNGLVGDSVDDIVGFVDGVLTGDNSMANINLRTPNPAAYPKANLKDAPYSVPEAKLRAAIRIPPTFKYGAAGAPQPVILVPGTGDTGYTTFVGNYIPLLTGSSIADPVWLNIPGYLLNDAQVNAEYVAYAINYIYGISRQRKVSVLAWSQGNIDAQWAYKYWPSTRPRVNDHIGFSADYDGTILANFIALGEPLPPSLLQQKYDSNFITTLKSNGGDSAYVPTTSVFSGFLDEIVQPQSGTAASAFINDARGVGVSNNEVQKICPGQPAGSFFTHEGTLYNALGYALAVDALTNPGPGQVSRLQNLNSICSNYLTPGLDLGDFLLTENSILIAGIAILAYPNKVITEPLIKSYAI